jgi:hypothetical protein
VVSLRSTTGCYGKLSSEQFDQLIYFFLFNAVFVFFWSRFLFVVGLFLRRSSLLSAREGSRCQLTIQCR